MKKEKIFTLLFALTFVVFFGCGQDGELISIEPEARQEVIKTGVKPLDFQSVEGPLNLVGGCFVEIVSPPSADIRLFWDDFLTVAQEVQIERLDQLVAGAEYVVVGSVLTSDKEFRDTTAILGQVYSYRATAVYTDPSGNEYFSEYVEFSNSSDGENRIVCSI